MKSEDLKNIFKEVVEKEYADLSVESDIIHYFIRYLKSYCEDNNIELTFDKEYPYKNGQRCDLHISTTEDSTSDDYFIEFKYYWEGSANDFLKQILYDRDKLLTLKDKGKLCIFCFYCNDFKETAERLCDQLKGSEIITDFISSH